MAKTLNDIYTEITSDKAKLAQLNAAKTDEGLVALAASYGVTATAEEIKSFIAEKKNAELSEDELAQVAGGKDDSSGTPKACPKCGSTKLHGIPGPMGTGVTVYYCDNPDCGYAWS